MLKLTNLSPEEFRQNPAAFGRLCVETLSRFTDSYAGVSAAFGRLCVETSLKQKVIRMANRQPPSGGCVLKLYGQAYIGGQNGPAAFGRLCVETSE